MLALGLYYDLILVLLKIPERNIHPFPPRYTCHGSPIPTTSKPSLCPSADPTTNKPSVNLGLGFLQEQDDLHKEGGHVDAYTRRIDLESMVS